MVSTGRCQFMNLLGGESHSVGHSPASSNAEADIAAATAEDPFAKRNASPHKQW
jgi:hypothetical protein